MLYLATMHSLMRNLQTITLLLALGTTGLFAPSASAQYNLDYGFCIGTGNYLGDIGGDKFARRDFVADLHLNQTRLSSHVFVRYRLSRIFAVEVSSAPSTSKTTTPCRLICPGLLGTQAFRNFVNELSFRTEVTLFQRPLITRYTSKFRAGINTYLTLGVTGFTHAPQAQLDELAIAEHLQRPARSPIKPSAFAPKMENGSTSALWKRKGSPTAKRRWVSRWVVGCRSSSTTKSAWHSNWSGTSPSLIIWTT